MLVSPPSARRKSFTLLLCAIVFLPASAHVSAATVSAAASQAVHTLSQIAVSPDGKRLAWVEGGEVRVAQLGSLDKHQRITAAKTSDSSCTESDPAWSPDSATLAFLSDCADLGGQDDLYLSHLDGLPPQRLTHLKGYVSAPAFSPDGTHIAFLYVENATRPSGALAAMDAPSGVIGEDRIQIQRVAAVTVPEPQLSGPAFLTPEGLYVYEFDWSPDSHTLAYIAADPPGENNWWVAKLYTETVVPPTTTGASGLSPLETGDKPTAVLSPSEIPGPLHGLQIAEPRWSPDGQAIAFIGGLMSDQGVTGGDVWIIDANGGTPRDLTPGRPATSQWIAWGDDQHIFTFEIANGENRLVRFRLQGDRTSESVATSFAPPVFTWPGQAGTSSSDRDLSVTADRSMFVFQASTFTKPPEIFVAGSGAKIIENAVKVPDPQTRGIGGTVTGGTAVADASGLTQLSHFSSAVKPGWGEAVSLTWSNDNFQIQGWLLLPAHYDPNKKYPLIVEVHGGPAADVASSWDGGGGGFTAGSFSNLGYFVLMPNPRGSFGQGEAFTQANRKDFGYGDLRDILAGVDAVLAKYSVDPNRVGITGWSYGGYMTMFAVTQTHRFRAAVAGAGISDWLSYYGENSIDQWMIPYFGASVYDDPKVYAKSSPIDFAKNANTPTLLLVGDRDGECPAPQSFEFWHALRDHHVPTRLVVYPNEGHGFADPNHRFDVQQRAIDWFARYMPEKP